MANNTEVNVLMCAESGPALVLQIPGPADLLEVATLFADDRVTREITDGDTRHEGFTHLYGVTQTGLGPEPILVTLTRED